MFSNILLVSFYSLLVILGVIFIFFNFVPLLREIIVYLTKLIFDIIDGGIILIKMVTPEGIYLMNSLIIFIILLYVLSFNNLVVILLFVYIGFITTVNSSVEIGKYYDKNYAIIRDKSRSYLYLDGNLKDTDKLIDKLGVDKVFINVNDKQNLFLNSMVKVEFKNNNVILHINGKRIEVDNIEDNFKYYSDIYPQKYYFMF